MQALWASRTWGVGLTEPDGYSGPLPEVLAAGKLGTPCARMQLVKRASAWR